MSKTSDFIDNMTQQQVFDFVVSHMKKQGQQSVGTSTGNKICMYRYGELKCVAGCLIHDDDYDLSMEGSGWEAVANRLSVKNYLPLIKSMQAHHDLNCSISSMLEGFRAVAKTFGLDDRVI